MTRKSLTERVPDRIEAWVALALCGAVLVAALVQWLVPSRPAYAEVFAPDWIALPAAVLAGLAATATMRGDHPPSPPRRVLYWSGCLLMTCTSGGLLLDLLRVVGLWLPIIPPVVDWPDMVTRALAASVVLAHLTLFRPPRESGGRAPSWSQSALLHVRISFEVQRRNKERQISGTKEVNEMAIKGMHGATRATVEGEWTTPLPTTKRAISLSALPEEAIRSVSASSSPLVSQSSSSRWTPGKAPTCTLE